MLARFCGLRPLALLSAVLLLFAAAPAVQAQQTPTQEEPSPGDAPAPGATITYEEAVRLALNRNYQLRLAENDVTAQSVSVAQNRAQFYPDLNFSAGGGRDFGRNFSQAEGGIVSQTSESANFSVSSNVNLFDGFRKDAALDQAQAQAQASSRTLRRRRQDVVFDVLNRYIELAQNRDLVDVREEQLALREEQLEQTEAQIEVGERAPSEVYQFQADVAAAEQQLLQAQRNVETAQTELVRLLVLDPFGEYEFETTTVEDVSEATLAPPSYELDPLLESAYDQRDDLDAQQAAIAAEEQGVRAARSGFWPSLSLSASYGSNWYSRASRAVPGTGSPPRTVELTPNGGGTPVEIEVPGTGTEPQYSTTPFFTQLNDRRGGGISFSLSYPLFDRFQTRHNVEQAQVQLENTRFQEELLRQDIAVEVRQARLDYQNARTQLGVAEERLQAAEQAQEAAQERYRLGAANYVELAQANADLAAAQSERVRAQYNLLLQQKRLDYVTGTLDLEAPLVP